jgi:hypothetical protein
VVYPQRPWGHGKRKKDYESKPKVALPSSFLFVCLFVFSVPVLITFHWLLETALLQSTDSLLGPANELTAGETLGILASILHLSPLL